VSAHFLASVTRYWQAPPKRSQRGAAAVYSIHASQLPSERFAIWFHGGYSRELGLSARLGVAESVGAFSSQSLFFPEEQWHMVYTERAAQWNRLLKRVTCRHRQRTLCRPRRFRPCWSSTSTTPDIETFVEVAKNVVEVGEGAESGY
jgi:hypothetical protein